jgi:hypothetical protein
MLSTFTLAVARVSEAHIFVKLTPLGDLLLIAPEKISNNALSF